MIARALFPAVLFAVPAFANDAFLAAEAIDVAQVKTVPHSPADPAWEKLKGSAVLVSPQRTVHLPDAEANALLETPGVGALTVKAAYSDSQLAVFVEWPDASQDLLTDEQFGDAVAIETPVKFGGATRLPFMGMGDDEQWVRIYMQRAKAGGQLTNTYVAAGFGSLTRSPAEAAMEMSWDASAKKWRAVFVRPLDPKGLVPIAFAVWDGARHERAGNKQLSRWRFLRLSKYPLDGEFVKAMAWGYGPGDLGDPAKGQPLVDAICAVCHKLPGRPTAPGLAPELNDIGVIATLPYLRDSVTSPSQVLVHHLNQNLHYAKSAEPDPNGAYPNAPNYLWNNRNDKGEQISKMPSFAGFSPQQVSDIVAYLKTLDGTRQ